MRPRYFDATMRPIFRYHDARSHLFPPKPIVFHFDHPLLAELIAALLPKPARVVGAVAIIAAAAPGRLRSAAVGVLGVTGPSGL